MRLEEGSCSGAAAEEDELWATLLPLLLLMSAGADGTAAAVAVWLSEMV